MDYKNYKQVYFRLNSPYKWGKGMEDSLSKKFNKEANDILEKIGLDITNDGSTLFSAPQGQHKAERLYMHPMDFSGILSVERLEKAKEVIENYKSSIFSIRTIDIKNVSDFEYLKEDFDKNLKKWKEFKG